MQDPATRARAIEKAKLTYQLPEVKQRRSDAARAVNSREDVREKHTAARPAAAEKRKRTEAMPETKQKRSKASLLVQQRPEVCAARMSANRAQGDKRWESLLEILQRTGCNHTQTAVIDGIAVGQSLSRIRQYGTLILDRPERRAALVGLGMTGLFNDDHYRKRCAEVSERRRRKKRM